MALLRFWSSLPTMLKLRKPGLVPGKSLSPSIKIDSVKEKYSAYNQGHVHRICVTPKIVWDASMSMPDCFKQFCMQLDIDKVITSSYHHQGNGQVEKSVKFVKYTITHDLTTIMMPWILTDFNGKICKSTETVHTQKENNVQNLYLAYIHNVQHAPFGDHQLDQVKFPYRFT